MNKYLVLSFIFTILSRAVCASEKVMEFPAFAYLKAVSVIIVFLFVLFFGLKFIASFKLKKAVLPSFDLSVVGRVAVEPGLNLFVIKIKDRYKLISSGTKNVSVIEDISDAVLFNDDIDSTDFKSALSYFVNKRKKSDDDKKNT